MGTSSVVYQKAFAFALFLLYVVEIKAIPPLTTLEKAYYHGHESRAVPDSRYRLDRRIIPEKYELDIRVILPTADPDYPFNSPRMFTAPATVVIDIQVDPTAEGEVSKIQVHSTTINFTSFDVTVHKFDDESAIFPVVRLERDLEAQIVNISLAQPLVIGERYKLKINYIAPIPDGRITSFGLYRTTYIDSDGETKYMAVTDFESVDARRMTPCFDEPDMKAKWKISVIRPKNYTSLSNMDQESTDEVNSFWDRDSYKLHVNSMSTYLVAIAVSGYKSELSKHPDPKFKVAIWGPPPIIDQKGGEYAATMSSNVEEFFSQYLDQDYTFPKMDKMAILDFSAGAMENWGLNTYRYIRLLHVPDESTVQEKVTMTNTIAHELAHQWFGNLVTMEWWDDLWLNEGFATYYASIGCSGGEPIGCADCRAVHPEYGWHDYIVVDSVQYAMQADVRATTHPMHYENLNTPAETRYGFDTISYDKGASILRMVNAFLSESNFRKVMQYYIKETLEKNANQNQLFDYIQARLSQEANGNDFLPAGKTMTDVMVTWTTQSGFPVLKVTRSENTLTVVQEHFVRDKASVTPGQQKWYVPIAWQSRDTPYDPEKSSNWLAPDQESLELNILTDAADYAILNPEQTRYYRVLYDDLTFNLTLDELQSNPQSFNPKTRSGLLDDYFNFAYAGYDGWDKALNVSKYLKKERTLVPWATFFTNMAVPYRLLSRTGAFYYFQKYVLDLMAEALADVGFVALPGEHVADKTLLRNRLFEWSCNLGNSACKKQSQDWVNEWINAVGDKSKRAPPDLRPFVYCTAVSSSSSSELGDLLQFFEDRYSDNVDIATDTQKLNFIRALACVEEPSQLSRLLFEKILNNDSTFPAENHRLAFAQAIAGNSFGHYVVFRALEDNLDRFLTTKGIGESGVVSIFSTFASYVSSPYEIEDFGKLLDNNKENLSTGAQNSITAHITTMKNNMGWIQKYYEPFKTWLAENKPSRGSGVSS